MECSLARCTGKVGGWRLSRSYPTCCHACTTIKQANKSTEARAKKQNKSTNLCGNQKCSRLVISSTGHSEFCTGCRADGFGESTNEVVSAKVCHDHRTTICCRNNVLCDEYRECFESVIDNPNGAFKYQINGGVNCWHSSGDNVERVNFGHSFGICSVNT